jgi:superfamily II DNA or RNA helicase
MQTRDYQLECVAKTFEAFQNGHKSVLNALPTGSGKTVVASLMAQQMDSFLFVVDREELAFQSQKTLQRVTGRSVYLECGPEFRAYKTAPGARCVVAMSQSMIRRKEAYPRDRFEYIFEDECHHSVSPTRTAIREYFTGKKGVIGFSATPERADGKAAGMVYETVPYQMSFLDAVDLGWLVPFKSRVVTCHDMDLRQFRGNAEYSTKELRKEIEKRAVIEHVAKKTIAIADGRQTVLFARTVQQSQQICEYLKSLGERAMHVDGKLPRFIRRDRLSQFSDRKIQFICNCGLIEEGVDVPGIEVVSMAAPIRSTGRFMQRVGRGSRAVVDLTGTTPEERRRQIAESEKPHFTVIDFVGQMDEHSAAMCFAGDLLAGDFDDEMRKVAIKLASGQDNADMRSIVQEAKNIVAHRRRKLTPHEEKEAARERYKKIERSREQAWIMGAVFHPFDVLKIDKKIADREVPKNDTYGRTMDASERYLRECHVPPREIGILTSSQRVYLARFLRARAETHAPYPQSRRIHACGYDASVLSKAEANALSARIVAANFVRPQEDGPNQQYLASQNGSPVSSSKDYVFI